MINEPHIQAAEDLLAYGYAAIQFPVSRHQIEKKIIDPFSALTALPERDRRKWCFDFSDNQRPDHGLVRRGSREQDDEKFFFHWRFADEPKRQLPQLLNYRGVSVAPYKPWFQSMNRLCGKALLAIEQVALGLDQVCPEFAPPGKSFAGELRTTAAMRQHVLRLLKYDAKPKQNDLADAHHDFSFLTVAIYESAPGLWKGDPNNPHHAEPGWALLFPGRKMEWFTGGRIENSVVTRGRIQALPHGVLSPTEAITRFAAVFFSHVDGPMGPSLEEVKAAA